MIPSPQGPLTEKEGTDNVYLDGQVMGSNPGVRSRSYGESPQIPKSIQPNYNYPSQMGSQFDNKFIAQVSAYWHCVPLSS